MSDPTAAASPPPGGPPPAAPKTAWQKTSQWLTIVFGIIAMILGAVKLYNVFVPGLPSCTASTTDSTIHDIFKSKDVNLTALTDKKTLTDGSNEKTCQAHIETPAEIGTIDYRIYWEGKNAQVQITKVDAHPR